MPLFGSKKILLAFLNNASLKFFQYELKSEGPTRTDAAEITFPEEVVKDSGIINLEAFNQQVSDFFKSKNEWKKAKTVLVIPEEKIFLKGFELGIKDLGKKQDLRKDFISEIPFLEEELVIKEKASGRILEFAAIEKKYIEDFKNSLANVSLEIIGAISLPNALISDLPSERSLLATFYDNDFVLVLSQNSRVIFSETERLVKTEIKKQVASVLDGFLKHPYFKDVKAATLLLDPKVPESFLKQKLEKSGLAVALSKEKAVFDLAAEYYFKNQKDKLSWDLLSAEKKNSKKYLAYTGIILFILALAGAGLFWWYRKAPPVEEPASLPTAPIAATSAPSVPEATTTSEAVKPILKENFPIKISNGTRVVGEAARLRTILQGEGFVVNSTGNYEDQNQILTTIFTKSDTPEVIYSELKSILEIYYQQVAVSSSLVPSEVIHIVIGRKK